jgi:predicted AlkP superfamily phosphohydrolase/phosphomutase
VPKKRVLLLGLDGATWDLIEPWVKEGKLPSFERLMKEGSWGNLESTIPPLSPSAWTSIFTGASPAKHNVYGFVKQKKDSYFFTPISSKDRKAKPIWKIISVAGKRIILINIPFSYPPDKVNGIMTTGLGTPSKNSNFVYPPGYKNKLLKEFPDYDVDFNEDLILLSTKPKQFLQQIHRVTEERIRLVKHLLETEVWDFFAVVLRALDVVQHYFWDDDGIVFNYYKRFDGFLNYILDALDDDTIFCLCSDHGFGAVKNYVYINNWLEKLGLLKIRNLSRLSSKKVDFLSAEKLQELLLKAGLKNLVWRLKRSVLLEKVLKFIPSSSYQHLSEIDWSKTKAYFLEGSAGLININLKGREPEGIVEEKEYLELRRYLADELSKLRDPVTETQIIRKIYTKGELYQQNSELMEAPDLILLKNKGYQFEGGYNHLRETFGLPYHGGVKRPGDHELNGILAILGAEIKAGVRIEAQVWDVAPTILRILGLPSFVDMEGQVLDNVFVDESLPPTRKVVAYQAREKIKEKIKKLKSNQKI